MAELDTYWLETLGCPKNQVDSDKLAGLLTQSGLAPAADVSVADVVVVNTCAFIEEARQESIGTIMALADLRREGARLVVTGCLAERYAAELREALPEVDEVAPFGVSFIGLGGSGPGGDTGQDRLGGDAGQDRMGGTPGAVPPDKAPSPASAPGRVSAVPVQLSERRGIPEFDLLRLPRPRAEAPWAYVKIAEGCDRACGFCAIPSFRGPQRSRSVDEILEEIDSLGAREVVLVAQDLASFGRDQGRGERRLIELVERATPLVDRLRLLYLYPSDLEDRLIEAIFATGVPYFDLSLQHVSSPLLKRMRRWGDGKRFTERISTIRSREPDAALRSNFIVGYPGETEQDHAMLLRFVEETELDWCGFFAFSSEDGTHAADLGGVVPRNLVEERLSELGELQDQITARRRDALIGRTVEVLVDEQGIGRTHREAPEIDGVVEVPDDLAVGEIHKVVVVGAIGPDLQAVVG